MARPGPGRCVGRQVVEVLNMAVFKGCSRGSARETLYNVEQE